MIITNSEIDLNKIAFTSLIPLSVTLELLTECNLRCRHCYIPKHNNRGISENAIAILLKNLRKSGTLFLTFTGGEVFLRKDFLDILQEARRLRFNISIFTNGTLLCEDIVKILSDIYVDEVAVSVYSMDEHIHDNITGTKGSLTQTLNALEILGKYSINTIIKTPLMQINAMCYNDIYLFAKQFNIRCKFSPTIFAKTDGNQSPISLNMTDENLNLIIKDIDTINKIFKNDNDNQYFDDLPCSAGFNCCSIDCEGNVYPCNQFLLKCGNIFEDEFFNIWNNSQSLKELRGTQTKHLIECDNCSLVEFCYRCPGLSLLEKNNYLLCSDAAKTIACARKNNK